MNTRAIRAVLFDLDGTLLDTAPDLVGALNHVRRHERMAPVALEEFRHLASRGALGLLRAGLPDADEDALELRRQRFLRHYQENLYEYTRPFAGVECMLAQLEANAIPWGIVTNKPEYLAIPVIEAVGWSSRAACLICGDTLEQRKPHPAPVLVACELTGVEPGQALLLGDAPGDLEAGEAAGVLVALATYGYGAWEVLESGRPVPLKVEHPGEVLALVGLEGFASGD